MVTRDPRQAQLFFRVSELVPSSDGALITVPPELEPDARDAILSDGHGECLEVGLQFPDWLREGRKAGWGGEHIVKEIPDKLEEKSVIYIRSVARLWRHIRD